MKKVILTQKMAEKIQDNIYSMSYKEKMKLFFVINNKVLSIARRKVKEIYSDLDPLLCALKFQKYIHENRKDYDDLFDKMAKDYLKNNKLLEKNG